MRLLPKDQDWTPYAYLIYLAYYLLVPFLVPHVPLWYKALSVAVTLAAVALYFAGYWIRGPRILWIVGAFVALGVALLPSNVAASVFFVYGASYLGKALEPPAAWRYLGAIVAIAGIEGVALHLPLYGSVPAVVFPALIGGIIIQQYQKKRLTDRLLVAQEEVERMAMIAERERISRDLHDVLGHTLSVIVLKSELASKLTAVDPGRAAEEIRDVERISREALAEVRAAVQGYRADGLAAEVSRARRVLRTAGVRLETSIQTPPLPPAQEGVLAMALREAVTNVVRHARAGVCRLDVRRSGAWCEMEVADDGRGGSLAEGNGLSGMRRRVEAVGGLLDVDGSAGTRLRIRVPAEASH